MNAIDQAVAALTDRRNFPARPPSTARVWKVDMDAVLAALERGGVTRDDARAAVVAALRRIGGEVARERLNRSRLRDGRVAVGREDYHEVWYVPVAAVAAGPQPSSRGSGASSAGSGASSGGSGESSSGSSGAGPAEWDPVK